MSGCCVNRVELNRRAFLATSIAAAPTWLTVLAGAVSVTVCMKRCRDCLRNEFANNNESPQELQTPDLQAVVAPKASRARFAGTNYGFLNGKPATASLLDVLGPVAGVPANRDHARPHRVGPNDLAVGAGPATRQGRSAGDLIRIDSK